MAESRYIPLTEWEKKHEFPTTSALRWLVFKGCDNGFSCCVRKVGRRVYLDEIAVLVWIDNQRVTA